MQKQVGSNKVLFALSREELTAEQRCSCSSRGPRSTSDHYSWKAGKKSQSHVHLIRWKSQFPSANNYTPGQTLKQNSEDTNTFVGHCSQSLGEPWSLCWQRIPEMVTEIECLREKMKEAMFASKWKTNRKKECCNYCNLDIRNWIN